MECLSQPIKNIIIADNLVSMLLETGVYESINALVIIPMCYLELI